MRQIILIARLCLLAAFLLLPSVVFGAHKVGEYYSSYYGSIYDIYADSTAENLYVFIHSGDERQLVVIVLRGKEQIDGLASKMDGLSKSWNIQGRMKGSLHDMTLRFSSDGEWYTSDGEQMKIRRDNGYLFLTSGRLKSGKARLRSAGLAFTKDELESFVSLLRTCCDSDVQPSFEINDPNIIYH